jgi:hypothetical protein
VLKAGFARMAGAMDGDVAKLRANGFPTEPADLVLKIKPEENAAPLYAKIMRDTDKDPSFSRAISDVEAGMSVRATPEKKRAAQVAYQTLRPYLAAIERAADRPRCEFDHDYAQGFNVLFPEFAKLKSYAKLLSFEALKQSEQGDWRGALRSIERAQRVGRHAAESPTLIGMLVGIALEAIASRSFEEVINDHRSNPEFLLAARRTLDRFGPLPSMRYAMGGELVLCRVSIQKMHSWSDITAMGTMEEPKPNVALDRTTFDPLRGVFEARLVRAYLSLEPSLPNDPAKWQITVAGMNAFEKKIESDKDLLNTLNRILFPVFSQAGAAVGKTAIQRQTLYASLDVLEAARQGKRMTSVPKRPEYKDPYDSGQLRMVRQGRNFAIYSIGPNGLDEGGLRPMGSARASDDIATYIGFKVATPATASSGGFPPSFGGPGFPAP